MVRRQQDADRAVRAAMRSPGAPPHQREVQRLFWVGIAKGVLPAEAAIAVGASQPVGQRWFHNAGGMPTHEAVYQSLYIEGRGALKRELVWCLRTGRALGAPRERSRRKTWAHVTPEVLISERPAEVEDRAVPGRWEGDLLIGLERSAIGTVVERTTRFTTLVHLPREEGYRHKQTVKNGPALAGYGALTMKNALANTMSTLPAQMLRSLTWDRGKEMSAHAQFKIETGIPVFFADPQSPGQRGTNENTVSVESGSVGLLSQAGAGSSR